MTIEDPELVWGEDPEEIIDWYDDDTPIMGSCLPLPRPPGELAGLINDGRLRFAWLEAVDGPRGAQLARRLANPGKEPDRLVCWLNAIDEKTRKAIVQRERPRELFWGTVSRWWIDVDALARALLADCAAPAPAATGETPEPGQARARDGKGGPVEIAAPAAINKAARTLAGVNDGGREITQKDAAQVADVSERQIRNWENGINTPPGFPGLRSEARFRVWANEYKTGKAGKQAANRELAKQQKAEAMAGGGR